MSFRVLLAPVLVLLGMLVSLVDFHLAEFIYLATPLVYLRDRVADSAWQSIEQSG